MAFGQPSGPPATAKQVQQLLTLLQQAGHSDFRDARGPLGFNQRQAAGKFTREEAEALIDKLQAEGVPFEAPPIQAAADRPAAAARPAAPAKSASRTSAARMPHALSTVPSSELAAELQRRGWVVVQP